MNPEKNIQQLVADVSSALLARKYMLVTAESCTGGMIGAACTDLAGSSAWFYGGIISYDNQAKVNGLGVAPETLATVGAVSAETVAEMCRGALAFGGDIAVAVSGVAGPGGGSELKPVGCVYIAWLLKGSEVVVERCQFQGDRADIRQATVIRALEGVLNQLK